MSTHFSTSRDGLDAVRNAHPIVDVLGRMGIGPEVSGMATADQDFRVPAAALGFGRGDDQTHEVLITPATPDRCWSDARGGRGGDVVALVGTATGLTQRESVAILGLGGPIAVGTPNTSAGPQAENPIEDRGAYYELPVLGRTSIERVRAVNTEAWRFYTSPKLAARARVFLSEHGVAPTDLATLERDACTPLAGCTPLSSVGLLEHLRLAGFNDLDVIDAGWAECRRELSPGPGIGHEPGQVVDRFRNRVLVPFTSIEGEVIGASGRAVSCFPGAQHQKYLFHPRTVVFDRSRAEYRPAGRSVRPGTSPAFVYEPLEILALATVEATH